MLSLTPYWGRRNGNELLTRAGTEYFPESSAFYCSVDIYKMLK
jgi:hypothetical protein